MIFRPSGSSKLCGRGGSGGRLAVSGMAPVLFTSLGIAGRDRPAIAGRYASQIRHASVSQVRLSVIYESRPLTLGAIGFDRLVATDSIDHARVPGSWFDPEPAGDRFRCIAPVRLGYPSRRTAI